MADCNYCGKTVSPNASHCPHCGEPDPAVSVSTSDGEEPAYGYIVGYTTLACTLAGPFVLYATGGGIKDLYQAIFLGVILGAIAGCAIGTFLYWIWCILTSFK